MGERTVNVRPGDIGATMKGLAEVIHGRWDASADESYTARLLQGPEDKVLKKVTELPIWCTTCSYALSAMALPWRSLQGNWTHAIGKSVLMKQGRRRGCIRSASIRGKRKAG